MSFIVLLKPFPNGNSAVRFFAGESLELVSEFELIMRLRAGAGSARAGSARAARARAARDKQSRGTWLEGNPPGRICRRPAREEPFERRLLPGSAPAGRVLLFVAALVLLAALLVVVAATWRRDPRPAPVSAPSPSLDLRVDRQKENFRVTWNRNLPSLGNATGTLTIDDGHQPRDLQLDAAQIAGGSVVYVSDAGDLTFRMRINGEAGHQFTESVRIVVDARPAPPEDHV